MPGEHEDPVGGERRGAFHRPEGSIAPMLFEIRGLASQVENDLRNAADRYDVDWTKRRRRRAIHGLGQPYAVDPMMDRGLMITLDRDVDALDRLRGLLAALQAQLLLGT